MNHASNADPVVKAQNDIADALLLLASILPSGVIKDFLIKLADFFERLTADKAVQAQAQHVLPQGFFDSKCLEELSGELRAIAVEAMGVAVNRIPGLLQKFLNCMMGNHAHSTSAQLELKTACLWQAAVTYFTTRDIAKTLQAFFACQFTGGGGNGGGGNGGGGSVPPGLEPIFNPAPRCNQ